MAADRVLTCRAQPGGARRRAGPKGNPERQAAARATRIHLPPAIYALQAP